MFPVFTLWRSANVSESVINDYYWPVKLGLGVKKYSLFVGLFITGLFILASIALLMKLNKLKKLKVVENDRSEVRDSDLMISLQPQLPNAGS